MWHYTLYDNSNSEIRTYFLLSRSKMSVLILIIIGAVCGILINYLADVLPIYRKPGKPLCSNCAKPYSLYNYLISFKCKNCGERVSVRTIFVLILSITASVILWSFPFQNISFWWTLSALVFLGVILVIDIEYRVVLIQTSIFGLGLLFLLGLLNQGFSIDGILTTIAGGVAGFVIMIGLYYFGILFSKIMSKLRKQEIVDIALGFGDVYVSTFLGLLIGWPSIISGIILAVLISGGFSILYLAILSIQKKYQSFSAIPYTPFLIIGAVLITYLLN
jgi:leader peptidase (prepilin peptidase)/N-methyltransferase